MPQACSKYAERRTSASERAADDVLRTWMQGLPTTSIQWGAWAGAGMAAADPGLAGRLRKAGVVMVPLKVRSTTMA